MGIAASRLVLVVSISSAAIVGQESPTATQPSESVAPNADMQVDGPFARVEAATELQVFPTELSPRYDESLAAGAVVRVGRVHGDFREILLPIGVRGFVYKKLTGSIEDGMIESTAKKVAFRYRPKSTEAPVAFVDQATEFRVAGEQGDWWIVRYEEGSAWLPNSALVVFDEPNPTLLASWSELDRQHRQACVDTIAAFEARDVAARVAAERKETLDTFRSRFAQELEKPVGEQDYSSLKADVETFLASVEPETDAHAVTASLRDRVDTQITIVEATRFTAAEPKPASVPSAVDPIADPLARFDAIGWLKYETSLTGHPTVVLMKGGQIQNYLTCTSGRYDLRVFHGLEVGAIGPRVRSSFESLRSLDVEKLQVLRLPLNR